MHIHVSPTTLLLFPEIAQKRPQLGPSPHVSSLGLASLKPRLRALHTRGRRGSYISSG